MVTNPHIQPPVFTSKNVCSFTGKEWCKSQWLAQRGPERGISETGYSYFGARYYDSDLSGLFLSVDPMADKYPGISPLNTTHKSALRAPQELVPYCPWNPVKLVDPDGNEAMENDDEWKYNMTSGLLSHVSDKGGKDQQTVHCVSNIGIQEVLNEIVSFNGQIEDMFDFSVINASWDQIKRFESR